MKILVGATGSIAGFKTAALVSKLIQAGHEVQVIATPSALEFVGKATFEGLTNKPVVCDTFAVGHMMDHIHLARWSDMFLVSPASAHFLGQAANGLASDLVTTTYLAYQKNKPVYITPAMNVEMWNSPAVQRNVSQLQNDGAILLEGAEGSLACGESGQGRMMEPDEIMARLFPKTSTNVNRRKILITCGGTNVPIDGVRKITNTSTGRTGLELAWALASKGHEVTALVSLNSIPTQSPELNARKQFLETRSTSNALPKFEFFETFHDLEVGLRMKVSSENWDAVIHSAAVSDYSVESIRDSETFEFLKNGNKIESNKKLTMTLSPNKKLVNAIADWSLNKKINIIAFKLTQTDSLIERNEAIQRLLTSKGVQYVVHNDMNEIPADRNMHPFTIFGAEGFDKSCKGALELASILSEIIEVKKTSNTVINESPLLQMALKKSLKSVEFKLGEKNDTLS